MGLFDESGLGISGMLNGGGQGFMGMPQTGFLGMLGGLFGKSPQGGSSDADTAQPGSPMQILPQVQQDAMASPSGLDQLKALLAKNPQALSGLANQFASQNKPGPVAPLPPINFPQPYRPQVYGSMMPPRIGS